MDHLERIFITLFWEVTEAWQYEGEVGIKERPSRKPWHSEDPGHWGTLPKGTKAGCSTNPLLGSEHARLCLSLLLPSGARALSSPGLSLCQLLQPSPRLARRSGPKHNCNNYSEGWANSPEMMMKSWTRGAGRLSGKDARMINHSHQALSSL